MIAGVDPCARLGVVMLTWNQLDMTRAGLEAVQRCNPAPWRLVLVDNGSRDGTVENIGREFPDVEVLALPENLGFCEANNRGARLLLQDCALDYIMFVNNDIDLEPDCLLRLVQFMDEHPRAGACGPLIFYDDPRDTIWAAGGRVFPDLMWFPPILRGSSDPGLHRARRVDYIHGCALLIRRQVLETVGLFDPRFFIYHDEVDLCMRIRQAGWSVWLVPEARLYHKVTQAVGQHSPMMIYYTSRNKFLICWKHGRWADIPKFYAFHLWKGIRIFARSGTPWAFVSLAKALKDALFGLFGRGHIDAARNRQS